MSQPDYQDDASIRDNERLFRRVHVSQLVRDDDTGLARVSSGAFKDRDLSVHIESILTGAGESAATCLRNHKSHKLLSITAADARRLHQAVCHDPQPEDPSHGLVFGSKTRSVQQGLRAAAAWVIPVAPPAYDEIESERRTLGI